MLRTENTSISVEWPITPDKKKIYFGFTIQIQTELKLVSQTH